jgi:hypothetical protein
MAPEQHATIEACKEGCRLLIAPKGFGKCMIGWTAAQEMLDQGFLRRVLVVAPLKVCELTWETEHIKWKHLREPAMALGDVNERRRAVGSHRRVVVVNIENLGWILNEYPGEFDGLVLDESSKFKTAGSVGVKRLRKHRKHFTWVLAMSATPIAEAGVDIYTQAGVVTGYRSPFRNQEAFRREFFYPTDWQQRNWKILPGSEETLSEILAPWLVMPDSTEYVDSLPLLYASPKLVKLDDGARETYRDMAEKAISEGVEAANAGVVVSKLQQICQGFMYRADGSVLEIHDVKKRALVDLLDSLEGPVLIVYQFRYEMEYLADLGIPALGDDPKVLEARWNRGYVPALAVHPLSAGHGINLQDGGHTLIKLGPIWSADQDDQIRGRLWRRGQKHSVKEITLVMQDTIDEEIVSRVQDKNSAEEVLMGHLKRATRGV